MNYLKELNAFREYVLRFHLPTSAVVLWYTLMQINNSTGWKKRFEASNSIVNQLCGLSKQSVANARTTLIEKGLIDYTPGKKGVAPIYQMLSVLDQLPYATKDSYTSTNTEPAQDQNINPTTNNDPSFDQCEEAKWNKLKEIPKQKERRKESKSEEDAFIVYEANFGILSPIARESLQEWIADMGDAMVIAAMKLAIKSGGQTFRYLEKILQE
ncbi:DnaD domain protein [Gracilibacillus kekensis]|uniref:DnaD and phage-associated domain-containing protein n=1 Tax=Gracilibacillus kekensis TaxID=1027249 RepID=A0A1M7LD00_9BACI|nr:DnaD domain protein [Gracilibacillus kekensis]SHM75927.1 DnaD and phage-associated domain-containing protein [Gracilibacillus kekensis]